MDLMQLSLNINVFELEFEFPLIFLLFFFNESLVFHSTVILQEIASINNIEYET